MRKLLTCILLAPLTVLAGGPTATNFEKTYKDSLGEHQLKFEIKADKNGSSLLKVDSYTNNKQDWKIREAVDCPEVDSTLDFFKNLILIEDTNKDGISEVYVPYQTFCGGGVDPYTIKIVVYENNKKYVLRGESLYYAKDAYPKGEFPKEYKLDTNISATKSIKDKVIQIWNTINK